MESRWHAAETHWSRDGPRLINDNVRRGCRLQDRGAVQGWSGNRQHVAAHCRGGREVRLARVGIREHEAFLGHEMWGPAETGRGGVSMASGRQGMSAGKREGARCRRLPSPPSFFCRIDLCILALAWYFRTGTKPIWQSGVSRSTYPFPQDLKRVHSSNPSHREPK